MSGFIYDDEVETIKLNGSEVDIKRKMSHGDHQFLSGQYLKLQADLDKSNVVDMNIDLDAFGDTALLLRNVKAWRGDLFTDRAGKPAPINRETINSLDPAITAKLLAEVAKRNPPFGAKK